MVDGVMRNEFEATCAVCGIALRPIEGIVHTRSRHRPFPVLCDSCMSEFEENEAEISDLEQEFG